MMRRLLIREKGLRSLVWLPIGLAAGMVLVALVKKPPGGLPFLPESFRPQYFFYPALYHWVYLSSFAVYAGVTGRTSRLYVALPITACALWLTRILAVMLGGIAIVAVQYGVLLAAGILQGHSLIDETLGNLSIGLTTCYVLGVLLAQIPCGSLNEIPLRPAYIAYLVAVWVLTLVMVTFVGAHPYLALLPAALAVLLFLRLYRSLPRSFAIVGRETSGSGPRRGGRSEEENGMPRGFLAGQSRVSRVSGAPGGGMSSALAASGRSRAGLSGDWNRRRAVVGILYNKWLTLLLFFWLAFVGLRNAGYGFGGLSNTTMVIWALLALSGLISYALPRLYMIDPLPISRKTLFAYLIIPGLAVSLAGYTVGTVRGKGLFTGQHIVTYGTKYYDPEYDVRVPLEYWDINAGGEPAPVEGCCDEAHATWSTELLKGTGIVLYSPYHVPAGSPPEVVAEQLSRAIQDVFGARVPPSELIGRYFERTPEGGTGLKVERMELLRDYPDLRPAAWLRILPLVYLCVGLPWFLYLIVAMGALHARTPGRSLLRGHLVITFTALGLLLAMIWASGNGITKEWKVSAAVGIILRKAATAIPGGAPSLWAASVILLVVLYLLARACFLRYEFPSRAGGPLA